eukprot:m.6431 g.6431  ORF g.6431 m.6431 type:complete len:87 (-) comp5158_c0_seq2:205-465(-)
MKVSVEVLLFAECRERAGKDSITCDVAPSYDNVDALLRAIIASVPEVADLSPSLMVAINEEYVPDQQAIVLTAEDVVALIPPLSGG